MKMKLITAVGMSVALAGGALAEKGNADALDNSLASPKTTASSLAERFTFRSYGELHAKVGDGTDNLDLHRLVLLVNVQLADKVKFISEIEFEHALSNVEGGRPALDLEKELEQAYFEFTLRDDLRLNVGVQLMPVGIVNVRHEPTTFYGVERPNMDKHIIPSTWRETAVGVIKTFDNGLEFNVMAHAGLDTDTGIIRDGRPENKDYLRSPESLAVTAAARFTGIAGVELGGALQFQSDMSSATGGNQSAYLMEGHGIYRKGSFEFRAQGAYWSADDYAGNDVDGQWGTYLEPSYNFETSVGKVGVFARYSYYDYLTSKGRRDVNEYTVGVNYWPIEEIVLKADFSNAAYNDIHDETFNFGVGYYF